MASKKKYIHNIRYLKYIILLGAINVSLATESITNKKIEPENLKNNHSLYLTQIFKNPKKEKPITIKPINTKIDFSKTYDAQKINNLTPHKSTVWEKIKGKPSSNAVLLDMLVWHFRESSRKKDRWNSQLMGIVYRGIYATTFLNSFSS